MQVIEYRGWRNRPKQLNGLRKIGRGLTSIVYDKGETVVKVTCDYPTVGVLTEDIVDVSGPHFPRVVEDYGIIGSIREKEVYMLEIEKLHKMWSMEKRSIIGQWNDMIQDPKGRKDLRLRMVEVLLKIKASDTVVEALETISYAIQMYDCFADMNPPNIMARGDGTLVFSDPVIDRSYVSWST